MKSWKEQRKKPLNTILFFVLFSIFLLLYSNILTSDEMVFKFKSPSFSGINTSQHYLTIENQQFSRKQAIEDNKQALLDDAERDTNNSTLARFIRNLESRVYAKLSSQLVDCLLYTSPSPRDGLLSRMPSSA